MNPKSINDLDPKLREAYERVMGNNFTPKSSPQPAAPTVPQTPTQQATEPSKPNPKPEQNNTPFMQTTQVFTPNTPQAPDPALNKAAPSEQTFATTTIEPPSGLFTESPSTAPTQKKRLNVLPILLILGGLVFFAAYIVIWAKVFGLF